MSLVGLIYSFLYKKKEINPCNLLVSTKPKMPIGTKTVKNSEAASHRDVHPPNPPWISLKPGAGDKAALSFYYSDPLSDIPVREVSHKNDPKPDPNLETWTFGLFSTCDRGMRAGIVRQGIELHFFCTNRGGVRVLTGYYLYGWYYKVPPIKEGSKQSLLDDYMLAAKEARFVAPGFPLHDLTGYLRGVRLDSWFRTFRYIDGETADGLLLLLKDTPDATSQYISEIHRLEQFTSERDGCIYRKKSTGFSWDVALRPMRLES